MEYKDREAKARVLSTQAQMTTFDYFYGFWLGIPLLRHSDNLGVSLQTKNLCAAKAQTIAKHTVATLKKVRTDENFPYIPGRCETKLDVNAPELSGQKRAPTRKEEIFGGKAAPEYANDVI